MKFISTLKTKIKDKIDAKIKEVIKEHLEELFTQKIEFLENDIDNILSSHNNISKDIFYLAESLKHIFILLDGLSENDNMFFENNDDDDKNFH